MIDCMKEDTIKKLIKISDSIFDEKDYIVLLHSKDEKDAFSAGFIEAYEYFMRHK